MWRNRFSQFTLLVIHCGVFKILCVLVKLVKNNYDDGTKRLFCSREWGVWGGGGIL